MDNPFFVTKQGEVVDRATDSVVGYVRRDKGRERLWIADSPWVTLRTHKTQRKAAQHIWSCWKES